MQVALSSLLSNLFPSAANDLLTQVLLGIETRRSEPYEQRRAMIPLLLLAVTLTSTLQLQQRSDCVAECAHLESHRAFETCVADCSRLPRKDNVPDVACESLLMCETPLTPSIPSFPDYPMPPTNVSIDTAVVIDNGKFLETTVTWSSAKGE